MKMVILGAGASFDSIYSEKRRDKHQWQPPLGKNLFSYEENYNEILKKYPGAEAFRSEINLSDDIEELFQRKYELSSRHHGVNYLVQIVNVQFYLQELFFTISEHYQGFSASNYDYLMAQAYEFFLKTGEEVIFISFNYDTLLERSFQKICSFQIKTIEDYISGPIKIIKPHGSCNWFTPIHLKRVVSNFNVTSRLPDFILNLDNYIHSERIINSRHNGIVLKNEIADKLHGPNSETVYLPKILIPLREKDEFVLPDTHIIELNKKLEKVDHILIIGWKANEMQFNKLMNRKLGDRAIKVLTVCGSDQNPDSNIKRWGNRVMIKKYTQSIVSDSDSRQIDYGSGTFSSYIREKDQFYSFFINN